MSVAAVHSEALALALAATRTAQSDSAEAERLVAAALLLAPDDPEVRAAAARGSGLVAATRGDLVAATRHLRRSARLADVHGLGERSCEAHGTLAYVLLLTTGSRAALRELARAQAAKPTGLTAARLGMQRGLVLQELHRLEESEHELTRALAALRSAGGDDLLEGDVRTNRAFGRIELADWAGAREDLAAAERIYLSLGHTGRTAMVLHDLGTLEARRGDLPAALAAYDAAAARYREAGLDANLLPVKRADALLGAGLADEACVTARQAVVHFEAQGNLVDLVQARLTLAEAALLAGDHALAREQAELARRSAQAQRRPRWSALAGHQVLRARWSAGDTTDAALRTAHRTAVELRAAGWPVQAADATLVAARIAVVRQRPQQAQALLADVASLRRRGPAELRARAFHAEALLRRAEGDRVGAARAVRAGLLVLEEFGAGLGATDMRAHATVHSRELSRLGVGLALESGRPRQVLAAVERARSGALRFRSARPPDDEALVAELAALRGIVAALGEAAEASLEEVATLLARRTAIEAAIRDRARHAAGTRTGSASADARTRFAALVAALGDRTLVEYVEQDGRLHAVLVRRGRATLHNLGAVQDVERASTGLRAGLVWLAHGRAGPAVESLVSRNADALDALLLAPLGLDDAALVVVPAGSLNELPWSALPSCAGRPVSVAPSAATWAQAAVRPVVGVGTVLAAGPGLEHAPGEVAAIARLRPGALRLSGTRATVAAVLAALDGSDTAHLAAHGTFRSDNPMFSQVRLADGPMTIYDLEGVNVPPRRLVLASCDSARGRVSGGDEVVGLAAALLSLGTTALVAAVLPVPDRASRALMVRLHGYLGAGDALASALARAQADLRYGDDPAARVVAAGYVCLGAG